MGSIFAEEILERPNPEVRLLSIGEEPEKGNHLILEAHALLRESGLNFKGNTEARELLRFAADVVVADGFTGNVALKLLEGTIKELLDALREEISATTSGKLGGLLIRPAARGLRTPPRPGHLRRRRTSSGSGALGDRARKLVPDGDRERDPAGRARGRERRRGSSFGADGGRFRAPRRPRPNEVRWQRRARKSSSESRRS